MIGKIKKFNFESLFILNTFALIVTSYFFNNFIFAGVYILFFFISILFFFLIKKLINTATIARTNFVSLIVVGIDSTFLFQNIINIIFPEIIQSY